MCAAEFEAARAREAEGGTGRQVWRARASRKMGIRWAGSQGRGSVGRRGTLWGKKD